MPKQVRNSDYSANHSIQRFKERYNKDLSVNAYNELNIKIRNFVHNKKQYDEIKLIKKTIIDKSNDSYVIEIIYNNDTIYANFETERNCITTFLPKSSFAQATNK